MIPLTTTLRVGVDSQPFDIDFGLSHNAACSVIWDLIGEPSFATLASTTSTTGKVRLNEVLLGDVSTYIMTISATVDFSIVNATFSVVIVDPCESTTFDTTSPISDFVIAITSASTGTALHPLNIKTTAQVAYPWLVCENIVTFGSPPVLGLSLAFDNSAVIADLAAIKSGLPATIASTPVILIASSQLYSSSVPSQVYSFVFTVSCTTDSVSFVGAIQN